jgi:pimeloyl-ACP methyl ester carboxylesterase
MAVSEVTEQERAMHTFVLIHGAWHGSWCWQRVRRALQHAGHDVHTPTLTGVGERSHLLSRDIDLDTHIADVVNLLRWEDLSDVVLCGHSYGGMVITGVADCVPERIRSLVYLDAFVPSDGECLLQFVPDEQRVGIRENADDGWRVPPIPAAIFHVNAEDRDWVDAQCTPQPLATFTQPIGLSRNGGDIRNVLYVLATGFETGSPFPQFVDLARQRGWRIVELPCGHDVMLDMPERLTELLLEAAG